MTDEPEPTQCECGQPLDTHPPLPRPPALVSWHAARGLDHRFLPKSGKGRPITLTGKRKQT